MNRILKFRVWDKINKCWYEPIFEAHKGRLKELTITLSGDLDMRTMEGTMHSSMFPDQYELMQFTGLHDKNGKSIFEGDIVKDDTLIMRIEYINSSFCKCNDKGNWIIHSHDCLEIIGNIFENPELL